MPDNPATEVKVIDLFRKEPEELTLTDITAIVKFYREQRIKFQEMEGKPKSKKKAAAVAPDPLDIKIGDVS